MELNQAEVVDRTQAIRTLTQTKGWKILQAHWLKLLARRRTEVSNFIRNGDFNRASQMQGWVDGVESILGEVERLSITREEESNPIY